MQTLEQKKLNMKIQILKVKIKLIKKVLPISGFIIRNKAIIDTKTIDNKYFK